MNMDKEEGLLLWKEIQLWLDRNQPGWRERINGGSQIAAVKARLYGRRLSDAEVFKGIVHAVLSSATNWSRVERVLTELDPLFHNYDLHIYATLSEKDIGNTIVPWFLKNKAGSRVLARNLKLLRQAAEQLVERSSHYGSLEVFLDSLANSYGDPIHLAMELGGGRSEHKLPALGIPIAAEALKNLGFDLAKPDTHINRAMGCWELVPFSHWPSRTGFHSPHASESEKVKVMVAMAQFAGWVQEPVTFLDNAVWTLCSQSGLHMTNASLVTLGKTKQTL